MLDMDPRLMLHSFELDGDGFATDDSLTVVVKEKDVYYQVVYYKL